MKKKADKYDMNLTKKAYYTITGQRKPDDRQSLLLEESPNITGQGAS